VRYPRFFDHPLYSAQAGAIPRKRSKAVKLGLANMLQVGSTRFSALTRNRGQWTDADQSAHGFSVDWQAWGTKSGLCWRATRDGLRHVPAGPPKSGAHENSLTPLTRDTRKPRLSGIEPRSPSSTCLRASRRKQRGKPHLQIEIHFPGVPHLPGPKKTRLSPRAEFSREEFLGCFWVEVRTPDSHALSNTWESVQKLGLLESC